MSLSADLLPTSSGNVTDALYNRYRPRKLADLIGQESVTGPLARALTGNKIHHAYLFSGPRGCGKTSTSRILAMCLVCEDGPTATPCERCEQCLGVINGNSLDVIEIDAATHNGVDDARDLRERAYFAPISARYKVFVVDEAHMVTPAAFNALLKIVEEPPPHVRFIFATTEPAKVLSTIRSRTHHYRFRLVPAPILGEYVTRIVDQENGVLDAGVLPLILRNGGGSVRDTLGLLGQLLNGADNGRVLLGETAALLGTTADNVIDDAVSALAKRNVAALLTSVADALDNGAEPKRFAEDLLDRLRDLLLYATTGVLPPLADVVGPERQTAWKTMSAQLGVEGLTSACEVLQTAIVNMSLGNPRIALEVACARMQLSVVGSIDVMSVLAKLEQHVTGNNVSASSASAPEKLVSVSTELADRPAAQNSSAGSVVVVPETSTNSHVPERAAEYGSAKIEPHREEAPPAVTSASNDNSAENSGDTGEGATTWEKILSVVGETSKAKAAMLSQHATVLEVKQRNIVLGMTAETFTKMVGTSAYSTLIVSAASAVLGGTWTVTAVTKRP